MILSLPIDFDVTDSVALRGATLDIPTFTRGCEQLSPASVEATRKLANVRIHCGEDCWCHLVTFPDFICNWIIQKELLTHNYRSVFLDSVVHVYCVLNNVLEGVIPFM